MPLVTSSALQLDRYSFSFYRSFFFSWAFSSFRILHLLASETPTYARTTSTYITHINTPAVAVLFPAL